MKRLATITILLSALLLLYGCNLKPSQPVASTGATSTTSPDESTAAAGQPWTATDLDNYLARKPTASHPSPLAGQGATLETYGQVYAVDPRLIVAIAAAETSYATGNCHSTPVVTTHNAWNWFWCEASDACGKDVCVSSTFDTWESGIQTVSLYIHKNYISKGYTNVELIASKYCTVGCENWVPNVTNSMREMNGNPENLTLNVP